jgi:membrane-associated PAP2 superfamily phosphatase
MASGPEGAQRFWLVHLWLPALFFALAAALIYVTDLDRRIATAWFFDAGTQSWVGAHRWWAVELIHGGRPWSGSSDSRPLS